MFIANKSNPEPSPSQNRKSVNWAICGWFYIPVFATAVCGKIYLPAPWQNGRASPRAELSWLSSFFLCFLVQKSCRCQSNAFASPFHSASPVLWASRSYKKPVVFNNNVYLRNLIHQFAGDKSVPKTKNGSSKFIGYPWVNSRVISRIIFRWLGQKPICSR